MLNIRKIFSASLVTVLSVTFGAAIFEAYAYTNLYVGGSGTVTVTPTLQQVTVSGNETNQGIESTNISLNGSPGIADAGVYGTYGYTTAFKSVAPYNGSSLGDGTSAEFLNASGTAGIGTYTYHGGCGLLQLYSVSSGQAFVSYLPSDVNLNNKDCIDAGITGPAGIKLGNGAVGYSEPILPNSPDGTLDFGVSTTRWRSGNFVNVSTTNLTATSATTTNFAVTGSATSTMGLAVVSSTAFVSDKGCANGHGFLFGGDQSTGLCSNTASTLKLITAGITRMQISSSGWTAVNNNVLDIGTVNTAMRDIYASGTIRGDQVYLGEDNTATSTLRVGRAGFNGGCIAISDDDKSGTTYCVGHNGTLTCSTTSCE